MSTIEIARHSPGIVVATLDRPPANAFGPEMLVELERAVTEIARDETSRVLVLRGAGRFFSAGADIAHMATTKGPDAPDRLATFARTIQACFDAIETLPVPSIAAIGGTATGGGLELALACDLRVAAVGARLGLPEVRLGLLPAAGGTQRLAELAGRATALDLILRGRLIDGAEAHRLGIVHEAVADTDVMIRAMSIATELAALPRPALTAIRHCIRLARSAEGFAAEIEATRMLHGESETKARVANFLTRKSTGTKEQRV